MRNRELNMLVGRIPSRLSELDTGFAVLSGQKNVTLSLLGRGKGEGEVARPWFGLLFPLSGAFAAAAMVLELSPSPPWREGKVGEGSPARTLAFSRGVECGDRVPRAVISRANPRALVPTAPRSRATSLYHAAWEMLRAEAGKRSETVSLSPVDTDHAIVAPSLSGGGEGGGRSSGMSRAASHREDNLPQAGEGAEGHFPAPGLRVFNNIFSPARGERARILLVGKGQARLTIYNRAAEPILELWSGTMEGEREILWNGRNSQGLDVSAGIYVLVAEMGENSFQLKLGVTK